MFVLYIFSSHYVSIKQNLLPQCQKLSFGNIPKSFNVDLYRAVLLDPSFRLLNAEGHQLPCTAPDETAIGLGIPGQRTSMPTKKELPVLLPVEGLLRKPEVVTAHPVAVTAYFLRRLRIVHLSINNLLQTYSSVSCTKNLQLLHHQPAFSI